MDHHCPWLGGGCVVSPPVPSLGPTSALTGARSDQGWTNYKFFLLALWYTGILGIYSSVILFHELVAFVGEYDDVRFLAPLSHSPPSSLTRATSRALNSHQSRGRWPPCSA
jgi:hypothetical protein